ncbi:MAG: hypothetical protein MUQ56_03990 [Thermoleophilia bacterium]|nr:hypothetical protein [Thermoleophilia bacterium]
MLEHTKRPDLVALTAGLDDFDRRLSETRQRSQALEAKTAAFHLRYVGAGATRPARSAATREGRLYPAPAPR